MTNPAGVQIQRVMAVLIVAAVVGIVLLFIIGNVFQVETNTAIPSEAAASEPAAQIGIYGTDLIVDLFGMGKSYSLRSISLIIEDCPISDVKSQTNVPGGIGKIVYPNLASEISGNHTVAVRGLFKDGTTVLFASENVSFPE